jgi:hypothetical protein
MDLSLQDGPMALELLTSISYANIVYFSRQLTSKAEYLVNIPKCVDGSQRTDNNLPRGKMF